MNSGDTSLSSRILGSLKKSGNDESKDSEVSMADLENPLLGNNQF